MEFILLGDPFTSEHRPQGRMDVWIDSLPMGAEANFVPRWRPYHECAWSRWRVWCSWRQSCWPLSAVGTSISTSINSMRAPGPGGRVGHG